MWIYSNAIALRRFASRTLSFRIIGARVVASSLLAVMFDHVLTAARNALANPCGWFLAFLASCRPYQAFRVGLFGRILGCQLAPHALRFCSLRVRIAVGSVLVRRYG